MAPRVDRERVIAALVRRVGCGVCRFTPAELATAPVEQLRITTDQGGDVWIEFRDHIEVDEDTWPVEE